MESLDNLLHEAECLERGSKGESVSAIGLNQLSKFFHQISQDQQKTPEGRILLAQQRVDSAKAEALLKEIESKQKPEESLSYISTQKTRHQKMSAYTAIQKFEMLKHDYNELQRKHFRDEMLLFFRNKEISQHPIGSNFKLFPTDPQKLGRLSEYAQLFANSQINSNIEPFSSVETIIKQSIKAIETSRNIDESTRQIRADFFIALFSIIGHFDSSIDLSQADNSPDILRTMACGSLNFLINQYRFLNFPNDEETTVEEIDNFVMQHYPNVQPPWPHIWVCIRAGFNKHVENFCKNYHRQTAEFWHYFNLYINQKLEPSPEIKSNVYIKTNPSNDYEAFRSFCYIFVIGEEVQQPPVEYLKTAEDFIFLLLSPHRYSNSSLNDNGDGGYSVLNDLQQLVSFEGSKIFNSSNNRFVFSMLLAIVLRFDACIDSLIENKLFPVEVLHILIIFYKAGLWKHNSSQIILSNIIGEFIELLPLTMTSQIVDYLSLVKDRKLLTKFLLSLDINEHYVDLDTESKRNALEMIQEEIDSNLYSITSLKLFVITLEYDNARKLIISISNEIPSTFTLKDISETVLICAILLNKMKLISTENVHLQNAALKIAIHVLSMSDQLTQSEKERLLSNVKQLRAELIFEENTTIDIFSLGVDQQSLQKLDLLSNLLHLLVLFDSGRSDLAIGEALRVKQIIPFSQQNLDQSIDWVEHNLLPSATLIGTVIVRFLSYYMDNNEKNKDTISTLFKFCARIRILSDDTNSKILSLQDRYTQLLKIL